ncbi:restriction endonuclease [Sporanaerobium hydrogeniformans]|uniref:Restriction endonuclease n=1 Tax=Sporanaerobium hydrogeniformans TaxID=3072179 RepID=A0AC61DD37_9FIRM|nr:LlaJI family restriction endonuclease [Sporanaerobium hydrogeniformans]PHV70690.1 restriction endonuclease [Sporanaerobium hydrogeniformans]
MSDLISEYVYEQRRYKKEELISLFKLSSSKTSIEFLKQLKSYGILKTVRIISNEKDFNDLRDDEVEIIDIDTSTNECLYVFTFVGVLTIGRRVIKSLPKYIKRTSNSVLKLKQVLRVLEKYNAKQQLIPMLNGEQQENSFNTLGIMIFMLRDYHEHGIYSNHQDIIETNGEGEILWDQTINETFAYINNKRPYYFELQTRNTIDDSENYFRRLHQFVLTECSNLLEGYDLLSLFDIESVQLSDENLSDFGETEYILYRLQSELNAQFITSKQTILMTLYTYVAHSKAFQNISGINMFGTTSFNLVWEKVCAEVFDNQLKTCLQNLRYPKLLDKDYQKKSKHTLLEIIEKPKWICYAEDRKFAHDAKDTLTPDLISIYENNKGMCFGIFDAKYYNIVLNKERVANQPGIGDVTKQYLYQLAYQDFISRHKFDYVKNAFLMPIDGEICMLGKVELGILQKITDPTLADILIIQLPATSMFKWYIENQRIDIYKEFNI